MPQHAEPWQIPDLHPLSDPISEVTRKERRYLLLTSLLILSVTFGNLVPTKVDALGIELTRGQGTSLLILLMAVHAYFLAAFVIYSHTDLAVWDSAAERLVQHYSGTETVDSVDRDIVQEHEQSERRRRTRELAEKLRIDFDRSSEESINDRPRARFRWQKWLSFYFEQQMRVLRRRLFFDVRVPVIVGVSSLLLSVTYLVFVMALE